MYVQVSDTVGVEKADAVGGIETTRDSLDVAVGHLEEVTVKLCVGVVEPECVPLMDATGDRRLGVGE